MPFGAVNQANLKDLIQLQLKKKQQAVPRPKPTAAASLIMIKEPRTNRTDDLAA